MEGLKALEALKSNEDYIIEETSEVYLISWRGNDPATISKKVVEEGISLTHLERLAHKGRNIEHITRVTGYFSKVSGWNKGKVAELIDRKRTPI